MSCAMSLRLHGPAGTHRSSLRRTPGGLADRRHRGAVRTPGSAAGAVGRVPAHEADVRRARDPDPDPRAVRPGRLAPLDLRVSALTVVPAGGSTSTTVANAGRAGARRSVLRLVLSADARRDRRDTVVARANVRGLPRGRKARVTVKLALPANLAAYLLACADDLGKVREARETNNCRAARVTAASQPAPAPTAPAVDQAPTPVPAPAPSSCAATDAPDLAHAPAATATASTARRRPRSSFRPPAPTPTRARRRRPSARSSRASPPPNSPPVAPC